MQHKCSTSAVRVQYEIEAKQKQVDLAKAEAERQQAIAKGEAERIRIVAQGEADSARIRAEGLRAAQGADYLRMLEIQNQAEAIKKWDGKLPTTSAGGAMPMIDLLKK